MNLLHVGAAALTLPLGVAAGIAAGIACLRAGRSLLVTFLASGLAGLGVGVIALLVLGGAR